MPTSASNEAKTLAKGLCFLNSQATKDEARYGVQAFQYKGTLTILDLITA